MQLLNKFNTEFHFLLLVIHINGKYAWITLLKDEKCITITNVIQKILDGTGLKSNPIWEMKVVNLTLN